MSTALHINTIHDIISAVERSDTPLGCFTSNSAIRKRASYLSSEAHTLLSMLKFRGEMSEAKKTEYERLYARYQRASYYTDARAQLDAAKDLWSFALNEAGNTSHDLITRTSSIPLPHRASDPSRTPSLAPAVPPPLVVPVIPPTPVIPLAPFVPPAPPVTHARWRDPPTPAVPSGVPPLPQDAREREAAERRLAMMPPRLTFPRHGEWRPRPPPQFRGSSGPTTEARPPAARSQPGPYVPVSWPPPAPPFVAMPAAVPVLTMVPQFAQPARAPIASAEWFAPPIPKRW